MVIVNAVFSFLVSMESCVSFYLPGSWQISAFQSSLSWVLRKILNAFNSCRILNSPSLNSPALGQVLHH